MVQQSFILAFQPVHGGLLEIHPWLVQVFFQVENVCFGTVPEEELAHAKATADDHSKALVELQIQRDELLTSSHVTSDSENMPIVREELHQQAAYYRTLESTNARLLSSKSDMQV